MIGFIPSVYTNGSVPAPRMRALLSLKQPSFYRVIIKCFEQILSDYYGQDTILEIGYKRKKESEHYPCIELT